LDRYATPALLSHVLDEKIGVAQTLLIDDELAEDERLSSVAARAYHRVVCDARVRLARRRAADWRTAGARARRSLVRRRSHADERVTEQNATHEQVQRLASTRPTRLRVYTHITSHQKYISTAHLRCLLE